jgi:putative polyketide hydroxylase
VARNGGHVLLVERHPSTTIFPQATGVNIRTMEVLRSWDLHRRIRAGEIAVRPLVSVSRTVCETDPVGVSLGYPLEPRACLAVSPVLPACCPRDHVEPVLLEHLRALGAEVRLSARADLAR